MQLLFQGDIGVLSLGNFFIQKKMPLELTFLISHKTLSKSTRTEELGILETQKIFRDQDFWLLGIENIITNFSRFGRCGIFFDRQTDFPQDLDLNFQNYKPKNRRAENKPKIKFFPTQILKHMAEEGFGGSVEFRRLARKFLRNAKNSNCDSVFFAESIFTQPKIKKTLQHLAGTQMKVFVSSDFLPILLEKNISDFSKNIKNTPPAFPTIKIYGEKMSDESFLFWQKQSEQILQTKLPERNFEII